MADLTAFDEVVIQDTSRNPVTVTSNRLDVNASIVGTVVDPILEALVVEQHTHYEIHEGNYYSATEYFSKVNSGVNRDYLITTDATHYAHINLGVSSSASGVLYFYEAPTATGGNSIAIINRNRPLAATNTAGTTITSAPTVNSVGTLLESTYVGGSKQRGGGASHNEIEFVLKTSTKYLLRYTSLENNNVISPNIVFYEETSV